MAPLTAGNRALTREGLAALNRADDAGIKALLEVSGIGPGRVDSEAVSFALAPRINAPGRMGHAEDGYKLLTAESEDEAAALAKALDEKNLERRTATAAIIDKVMEQRSAFESSPIIILGDADFPPGVVGLAAGRLTDQYYRPAVVCTTGPEETRGSCRSIPEFNIIEALRRVDREGNEIFLRYGGHAQAAGFTVAAERFDELNERLTAVAAEELLGVELAPRLDIDAEVSLDRIDGPTIKALRRVEPYGQGNPPPTFLARGVEALDARPLGTGGDMHFAFSYATQIALVSVDLNTGVVHCEKIISATDIGRAINPMLLQGQIEGGIVMALGNALTESYIVEDGVPWSTLLARYKMPSIKHTPEIVSYLVEDPVAAGPFGAKGVGEIPSINTMPAITNAIFNAVGVRVFSLPVDQDALLLALRRGETEVHTAWHDLREIRQRV